ncbi:hypothetical protein BXY41_101227 [Lacrimispora xylanisolvens]|uniref:Lysozyme inhibitor LprI N-terminal domain-containing protein n=1 Tax=Lacrimispora xylanisolvens TaxID=384636 RepID=A0A2S6HYD6_9FIRM|nr:hypothetical protein [Hungatella xylanolytica]PPK83164.1 hypothetical protein BXY41_101227 [Hungatella xylanolytica]
MKKYIVILAFLGLFLLSSCSKSSSTEGITNEQMSPSSLSTTKSENESSSSNISPTPLTSDTDALSPMQTFKAVLLNEQTLLCTDKSPYNDLDHEWNGYLNELAYDSNPIKTPQFAVVDLDGDGVSEVVLAIEDYNGFIILRYKEGNVYGFIVSYRTMYNLKADGSFMSSSSSSDTSVSKVLFIGDTFFQDDMINSVGGTPDITYFKHDMPVDKDTFDKHLDSFDSLPDVEWHDYCQQAIDQLLVDSTETKDAVSKSDSYDRQNYLDTLAYLMDFRAYYNISLEDQEEVNLNARNYKNGCYNEMNKIFKLCLEKLSEDELEVLRTTQQEWQEHYDQRLSEYLSEHNANNMEDLVDQSMYYELGDMMLRKTFLLINLYYDYHFYD